MKKLASPRALALTAAVVWYVVGVVPGSAGAQEPRRLEQPQSIPYELASALISAGGLSGDPQILIGSMPEWVVKKLYLPAGARVLGSAFIGTTVVGIASVSTPPEVAAADLRAGLLAHGWKAPPPPPNYGGGFRPAPVNVFPAGTTRGTLCGDQEVLTTSAVPQRGVATILTYRLITATGFSTCKPPVMPQGYSRSPMPTLYNPAASTDARMTGDCSNVMGSSNGTSTTLRTSLAPDAILEHYGKQLADSGWKPTGDKPTISGRTWTRTDSAGAPVELSISIATSVRDANCRETSLQIRSPTRP
jgi:hypothetical protein